FHSRHRSRVRTYGRGRGRSTSPWGRLLAYLCGKAWNAARRPPPGKREEAMAMQQATYPVQFSVDYPDRPLNRLTTAFRIFVAIPILIVLGSVSGSEWARFSTHKSTIALSGAGGLLFFGPLLMILFRQKYPRWWFDWNLELQRFSNRVGIYLALM